MVLQYISPYLLWWWTYANAIVTFIYLLKGTYKIYYVAGKLTKKDWFNKLKQFFLAVAFKDFLCVVLIWSLFLMANRCTVFKQKKSTRLPHFFNSTMLLCFIGFLNWTWFYLPKNMIYFNGNKSLLFLQKEQATNESVNWRAFE